MDLPCVHGGDPQGLQVKELQWEQIGTILKGTPLYISLCQENWAIMCLDHIY